MGPRLSGPGDGVLEAGPTGFCLARALVAAGIGCEVVAPSRLERPPGDKVKTDRWDAERLARLLRIGELPAVRVPSEAEEAARTGAGPRGRAHGSDAGTSPALEAVAAPGLVWEATAWTGSHEQWLRGEHFDRRGVQLAFDEALDAVFTIGARRDRLNTAIVEMAETEPLAGPVGRLRCLRGVSTMTAVGLRVEIADWQRFTGATIGAYLGLVPCECSSGDRRVQGGITKTGNTHARWLLVEAAWRHRRPLRTSRASPFVPWRTSCCSTHREDPRGIPRNLRVAARARRAHARARAGGQPTSASPG